MISFEKITSEKISFKEMAERLAIYNMKINKAIKANAKTTLQAAEEFKKALSNLK